MIAPALRLRWIAALARDSNFCSLLVREVSRTVRPTCICSYKISCAFLLVFKTLRVAPYYILHYFCEDLGAVTMLLVTIADLYYIYALARFCSRCSLFAHAQNSGWRGRARRRGWRGCIQYYIAGTFYIATPYYIARLLILLTIFSDI